AKDDQVVQHAAALVAEERILTVPDPEPRYVVDGQFLAYRGSFRTAELELAHVAHVEDPATFAHGTVLLGGAPIEERHLPPGELRHPGAEGLVRLVEGRA